MIDKITFEKTMIEPMNFWGNKSKEEVRELLGEQVSIMVNYNQRNPHHCFDLFQHSLHTVANLGDDASVDIRIAAFFHDIGKPHVAKEKDGRLVFYGHAKKSAEIARKLLRELRYDAVAIARISFFIEHHDDFISWVLPTELYDRKNPHLVEITPYNVISHIVKADVDSHILGYSGVHDIWAELVALCKADSGAQSEIVYKGEIIVDSREHKLKKLIAIEDIIRDDIAEKIEYWSLINKLI